MTDLVEFSLGDGDTVVVEIDEPVGERGLSRAARRGDGLVVESGKRFDQVTRVVRPAAEVVLSALRDLSPSMVVVEFGVKMSFSAGAVIAASSGDANFKITCTWQPTGDDPG